MAYQTSCASYTSGRVGLSSATAVVADAAGREQTQHGSPLFPIACYAEDLSCYRWRGTGTRNLSSFWRRWDPFMWM